jgi:hypothetical protein
MVCGSFLRKKVTPPMEPKDLAAHELKDMNVRGIISDAVKDHFIAHISEKKSTREMFVAVMNLFQSRNIYRKMVLKENIRHQDD